METPESYSFKLQKPKHFDIIWLCSLNPLLALFYKTNHNSLRDAKGLGGLYQAGCLGLQARVEWSHQPHASAGYSLIQRGDHCSSQDCRTHLCLFWHGCPGEQGSCMFISGWGYPANKMYFWDCFWPWHHVIVLLWCYDLIWLHALFTNILELCVIHVLKSDTAWWCSLVCMRFLELLINHGKCCVTASSDQHPLKTYPQQWQKKKSIIAFLSCQFFLKQT